MADAVYGSSTRAKDSDFLRKSNNKDNRSNDDQSDEYADELFDYEERVEIKGFK